MYSVKPGRGPSFMGVLAGIVMAIFGLAFGFTAMSHGAPAIFGLFGVLFAVLALGGSIYNGINATSKNRMSQFDITTDREESDPIADMLGHTQHGRTEHTIVDRSPSRSQGTPRQYEGNYCPFCGQPVQKDFDFCPQCGKDI